MKAHLVGLLALGLGLSAAFGQSRQEMESALLKAVEFYHQQVANHGGYVYRYSSDLTLREAEGYPDEDTIWIQPPGSPAVGEAFMDAYKVTKSPICSKAALDVARALARTQLHSGGWYYRGHFDAARRSEFTYRLDLSGAETTGIVPQDQQSAKGGWSIWRQREYGPANQTIYDDDVTQAALRLMIRVDAAMQFRDQEIHDATLYGLKAMLGVQYPNGGFSANYDRYPNQATPDAGAYPVKKASYPKDWSRTWTKDFSGSYVTNDNLHTNCISTLITAWETYKDPQYLDALKKAGEFVLLAQMPDPQPAWCQAYSPEMHPVWDRAFEPPAIAGRESQTLLWKVLEIYRVTGDKRYLESARRAMDYLKASLLSDGMVSRFYELETNRPLFFTRGPGGNGHIMTFERERLASNYGWIIESELDLLEQQYQALATQGAQAPRIRPPAEVTVSEVLSAQDDRGAWTEDGFVRDSQGKKQSPAGGIIESLTFIRNVGVLCEALKE